MTSISDYDEYDSITGDVHVSKDFLLCLKFLYTEALRKGYVNAAEGLEKTFEEAIQSYPKDEKGFIDEIYAEFRLLREFRSLDVSQRKLLIEYIQQENFG